MIKRTLKATFNYFISYRTVCLGLLFCYICCFSFRFIFTEDLDKAIYIPVVLFLTVSFIFPVILGINFAFKSFIGKTKGEILSNIIHSYLGTILIFAAAYYQLCVFSDFQDAISKRDKYQYQVNIKNTLKPNLEIMRVADIRAFKGIKPRLWSSVDYPSSSMLYSPADNPDGFRRYVNNEYEELSIQQIERIVQNEGQYLEIEYQSQNVTDVYTDCLYFSVICIATVGFGDISPNLWYTKLFASLEVFIGMSIFIFAIGMLFSTWKEKQ